MRQKTKNKTGVENKALLSCVLKMTEGCWQNLSLVARLNGEWLVQGGQRDPVSQQQKVAAETGSSVQTAVSMMQPVKAES